jgi:hypothetical protein
MKYRNSLIGGRWFFGFTVMRLSVFVGWKCEATWRNYGRHLTQ